MAENAFQNAEMVFEKMTKNVMIKTMKMMMDAQKIAVWSQDMFACHSTQLSEA